MKGWLVRVPMVRIGGHPEMDELYAVGASGAIEALAILRGQVTIAIGQEPEAIAELPSAAMLRLGVGQGQVGMIQART